MDDPKLAIKFPCMNQCRICKGLAENPKDPYAMARELDKDENQFGGADRCSICGHCDRYCKGA